MPQLDIDAYDALIRLTYAAGLDRSKWLKVLETVSNSVGHMSLAISGHDHVSNCNVGFVSYNYDPEFRRSYVEHYAGINPWNSVIAKMPAGRVVRSQEIITPENLRRTEFYADWIRPQDDIGTGAGITLFKEPGRFLRLSANIRFRDQERLQDSVVTLLNRLGRHFAASFELARQLSGARIGEHYHAVVEQLPMAVFLLDYSGRVTMLNGAADRLQADGTQLTMDSKGRLVLSDPAVQKAVDATFNEIASGSPQSLGPMLVRGDVRQRPLRLTMSPFIIQEPIEAPFRILVDDHPVAIVTADTTGGYSLGSADLAALYRLTAAERALAEHLSAGGALSDFAVSREVSIHTARNQLKSLMGKVGASRQAELVRIVRGAK